jgi:hypothetical protein
MRQGHTERNDVHRRVHDDRSSRSVSLLPSHHLKAEINLINLKNERRPANHEMGSERLEQQRVGSSQGALPKRGPLTTVAASGAQINPT